VDAEILLVADRKPGSTHKFFHNWRIDVVAGMDQAVPGSVLLTIPIGHQALVDSGWQYWLQRQAPRPGFEALDTATFSWMAKAKASTPDLFATATAQARAWLADAATAGNGATGAGDPQLIRPLSNRRPLTPRASASRSTSENREEHSDD
jgi:hypothetical protein